MSEQDVTTEVMEHNDSDTDEKRTVQYLLNS